MIQEQKYCSKCCHTQQSSIDKSKRVGKALFIDGSNKETSCAPDYTAVQLSGDLLFDVGEVKKIKDIVISLRSA